MTNYPDSLDTDLTLPQIQNGATEITADSINSIRDAALKIEQTLGVNPQGNLTDLVTRINGVIDDNGNIKASALSSIGLVTLPIYDAQIASNANIQESKLALTYSTTALNAGISAAQSAINTVTASLGGVSNTLNQHIVGSNAHDGYNIYTMSAIRNSSTVEGVLHQLDNVLIDHETNPNAIAHAAQTISVVDDFIGFDASNVQQALDGLNTSAAGKIETHQALEHQNAIEFNPNETGQVNLSMTTCTSTIFQTDKTIAANILQVMRPGVARITSKGLNIQALQLGVAAIFEVQTSDMLAPLVIDLSPVLPTQNIDDVVSQINTVAQSAAYHYPISAYNTSGRLTIAHNIPDQTIQILPSLTVDATTALGFGSIINNTYGGSTDGYAAYVNGSRISTLQSLLKLTGYTHSGGTSIAPNFGDLDAYGFGNVICNITNYTSNIVPNGTYNGTYYVGSFNNTHTAFNLNTAITTGVFDLEIVADSVALPVSYNGQLFDIFLATGADGYGIVTDSLRISYTSIPYVVFRTVSKDFNAATWAFNSNNAFVISDSNAISSPAVTIPIGFVGAVEIYAADNVNSAILEVYGNPSYFTRALTTYPFNDAIGLYLASVHSGGNFGPQTLKYLTDKRLLGGTIDNVREDYLMPTELSSALKKLRNNGILNGFDVISYTNSPAASFKIRGGQVLVNGNIFNIPTQDIYVNSAGTNTWLLVVDKSGELVIKNETTPGFSLTDLVAGDSYGDNVGVALIVEFTTSGGTLTGVFNDKRLIISKIDKKLYDTNSSVDALAALIGHGVTIDGYFNTLDASEISNGGPLTATLNTLAFNYDGTTLNLNGSHQLQVNVSSIPHNNLANLTGDAHPQYLLLNGVTRGGEQSVLGDVSISGGIINGPLKTALDGYQANLIVLDGYVTTAQMDAYVASTVSAYVPYSGATTNVSLGAHQITNAAFSGTGHGAFFYSGTSDGYAGVVGYCGAANGVGVEGIGQGSGEGASFQGGNTSAAGVLGTGGTGGDGLVAHGSTASGPDGAGASARLGLGGNNGHGGLLVGYGGGAGIYATGGATNGYGTIGIGTSAGAGGDFTGGATGPGVNGHTTSGAVGTLGVYIGGGNDFGILGTGIGSGTGGYFTGGPTGYGVQAQTATFTGGGTAIGRLGYYVNASSAHGVRGDGYGTGYGGYFTGGPSSSNGYGIVGYGGSHNGSAGGYFSSNATNGYGINVVGVGTGIAGVFTGGASSNAISASSNAGSLGVLGRYVDGVNDRGLDAYGIGTGAGGYFTGGLTGNGVDAYAGATNGYGIVATGIGSGYGGYFSGGIGAVYASGNIISTGQIVPNSDAYYAPAGTSQTIDCNSGNLQTLNLGSASGSVTATFSNLKTGGSYAIKVIQSNVGGYTVTWSPTVKWAGGVAPTLTAVANAVDIFSFLYDGTSLYGSANQNMS